MPTQITPVSGVFPTDANYIVWRLGFKQSSYSPYRAGPSSASFHTPGHDRWFSGHACLVTFTFQIQLLVNNAGVMALPERTTTPQRWQTQFATNHLGHAALTLGLHDALAAAQGARIVVVSSSAHLISPVVFYDIHFTFRPYDAWSAYGQSKTAAILFTVATAKKWAADGITANALHPGGIMTNLQRHLDEAQLRFVGAVAKQGRRMDVPPGWKNPAAGSGHLRPAGRLPARRRGDRALLRRLQRGRRRHRAG